MFFRSIPQDEVKDVVRFLVERHGDDARAEAERLAEVGRRLGSWRNSKVFRLAALALSGQGGGAPKSGAPQRQQAPRSWRDALREYGRPRIETPPPER
jgi:hypothetical protein